MALCGHTTEALSWLMDYGVMSIACACTRPKSVDVRFYFRLTDLAVREAGDYPAHLTALRRLIEASHGQCGSVLGGAYLNAQAPESLTMQAAGEAEKARAPRRGNDPDILKRSDVEPF